MKQRLERQDLTTPLYMIALTGALILLISVGARQSYGLFLSPLSDKLQTGRESFSLAIAFANLLWGLAAPLTGRLADRYGALPVLIPGTLLFALGFAGLALSGNSTDLVICGFTMGLGLGATGFTVIIGTVGRVAPTEYRDKAITIASLGSAIGMFLTIPFVSLLLSRLNIDGALYAVSGMILLILCLAFPFQWLATQLAQKPEGQDVLPCQGLSGADYLKHSLCNRNYLFLMAGFFVCGFHIAFTAVHLPAFLEDATGKAGPGTTALFLIGLGNVFGTFIAGTLGSYYSKTRVLSLIYMARGVLFLCFLLLPFHTGVIYFLSFLMGLLWLGTIPLTSGLVAELYGVRWLSMLFGVVFLSHQVGAFFGSWIGGVVFDASRSYDLMWIITAGLAFGSAFLHMPIEARLQLSPAET